MNYLENFEPTEEQFGAFWKYLQDINVTDVDYNGRELWITDLVRGHYRAKEEIDDRFLIQFTHTIANAVNKQFNRANKVLEADTKELRISILHDSVSMGGISVCIRKSPPLVRNRLRDLITTGFFTEEMLALLINCIKTGFNVVSGGEPGHGKTEFVKFLMQFIPDNNRVITIEDSLELHYGDINPGSDYVELRIEPGFDYTDAIKACLRQNPKWLVLSEARSAEVTYLMEAWSTGIKGLTTIHLDDLRKLPDRIQNMMNNVNDADRMETRIYRYVNVGVLIRRVEDENGKIRRYIDQLCFYVRENSENKVCMLVKDGILVSREIPAEMKLKFERVGIADPFLCDMNQYIQEGL